MTRWKYSRITFFITMFSVGAMGMPIAGAWWMTEYPTRDIEWPLILWMLSLGAVLMGWTGYDQELEDLRAPSAKK